MSHNEKRTHWLKEGAISLGVGVCYGATVVITAHPFDTIKTKMQVDPAYNNRGMFNSSLKLLRTEGVIGFYRGFFPPLVGSGMYRSIQFSAFEATYTFLDNNFGKSTIPFTNGVENRVVIGGIMAGSVRSLIETPLEYAKIARQCGRSYKIRDLYTGMTITWMRASVLMPFYFIYLDYFRRNFDTMFTSNIIGPFLASGVGSVAAWWMCWPLELVKCQIQSGHMKEKNWSIWQRLKFIVKERGGVFALYRGIAPGSLRSFVGNGSGMVIMQYLQKKVTQSGIRD